MLILSIESEYQGKSEIESEVELKVKYVEPDVEKSNLMSSLRSNVANLNLLSPCTFPLISYTTGVTLHPF